MSVQEFQKEQGLVKSGPVAETLCSQCRSPGSIPGQGTRYHMLQLRPTTNKKIFLKNKKSKDSQVRNPGSI